MTAYRIHRADKHEKVLQLRDLLVGIPIEQTEELLAEANKMLCNRNVKIDDAYRYENFLIAEAEKHIAAGDPVKAYWECLSETNHGHSGFTHNTRRIYMRPINDTEREVSKNIRKMIIAVAYALIKSDPLSKNVEDGWVSISSIYGCLVLLGEHQEPGMVEKLKEIIAQCKKFVKENVEISRLVVNFKNRFGD